MHEVPCGQSSQHIIQAVLIGSSITSREVLQAGIISHSRKGEKATDARHLAQSVTSGMFIWKELSKKKKQESVTI